MLYLSTNYLTFLQRIKKGRTGCLLILDDMLCSANAISNKRSSLLKKVFYQGRHYGLGVILVSQAYADVPANMRRNSSHMLVFNLKNKKAIESFVEEMGQFGEDFPSTYKEATKEPYSFLYLDLHRGRAYRCFEERLL